MFARYFNNYRKIFLLLPLIFLFSASTVFAQGTAFTFQGKLGDSGTPVSGSFDMQFKLFAGPDRDPNNPDLGLTGTPITMPLVQVTNGVFTVQLDFGSAALPGSDRFLEIGVRRNNAEPYSVLSPRSKITSSPYAIRSLNATNATNADGLSTNCVGCILSSHINSVDASKLTGSFNISGNGTLGGTLSANVVSAGTISGNGSSLTNLNAGNFTSGTVSTNRGGTGLTSSGTAGNFLRSSGTNWTSSGLASSDIPGGSVNYIQNTPIQQTANFSVLGQGVIAGGLRISSGTSANLYLLFAQNDNFGRGGLSGQGGPSGGSGVPGGVGVNGVGGSVPNNGTLGVSGIGVNAVGGDNPIGEAGIGVVARGGQSLIYKGGPGVVGFGGSSTVGEGAAGLEAHGGNGSTKAGAGILAIGGVGPNSFAGWFVGNVNVTGSLLKGGGSFKIDHPLDPENKYLYHSFVESPDMMNIYNGNVVTDGNGDAVVEMPDYFEALNKEFRYQLTVIGTFAQAIVAEEISGNRFKIRTSAPHVKVSWQVTGIRHDAWAEKNRIKVEVKKDDRERGFYLYPEVFNQPEERGILWSLQPEMMMQMKKHREEFDRARSGQLGTKNGSTTISSKEAGPKQL